MLRLRAYECSDARWGAFINAITNAEPALYLSIMALQQRSKPCCATPRPTEGLLGRQADVLHKDATVQHVLLTEGEVAVDLQAAAIVPILEGMLLPHRDIYHVWSMLHILHTISASSSPRPGLQETI